MKKSTVMCHRALFILGLSVLAYCFLGVLQTVAFQARSYRQLQLLRSANQSQNGLSPARPVAIGDLASKEEQPRQKRLADMSILAFLNIPSIHASAMVAEGDSPRVLERAVGHVPGTALPGRPGNVVLAGHRDTFFRKLGDIEKATSSHWKRSAGNYLYRVQSTGVVGPGATWVLDPSAGQTLTLITCYPFYFIGPAPKRFVVRANRLATNH